jgi:hypothetical protein
VDVDADGVTCTPPDGWVDAVRWSALLLVGVETTDTGPFIEDIYFYLEGYGYGFHIPQGVEGVDELVRRLVGLPGFDSEAFAAAMSSTANARFICWRKGNAEPGAAADRPRE